MDRIPIWVLFISLFLLLHITNSEEEDVKRSLAKFYEQLWSGNGQRDPSWGWNATSDPCTDKWKGVICDSQSISVKKIILNGLNLTGTLDASSLCTAKSLVVLRLNDNHIDGEIPEEISNCKQLTHLNVSWNQFSGNLPSNLSRLNNLKRLDISNNNFSGNLPELPRISGLISFLAQTNQLSGEIPQFDFSNLAQFNVSFNNFSGPIPDLHGNFKESSFTGNPELCGKPLPKACPPSPPPKKSSKGQKIEQVLMYSGYILLGLAFMFFVAFRLAKRKKTKEEDVVKKGTVVDGSINKPSTAPSDYKAGASRSEFSITSADQSAMVLSPLVVLTSPVVKGLKFEDLLKAPAEVLGRGRHGSLYKVIFEDRMTLAVKRIKDWAISSEDFKRRMQKIDQAKHPNVLPALAFYCSKQEKLVVYEYQQNGSLYRLLHGTQNGQKFEWGSRLSVAASIAEALAFMHEEFHGDGIGHGNLKSTNILMNKNMEPCISEYGLMASDSQDHSSLSRGNSFKAIDPKSGTMNSTFKADMYGFGVILLELLTGKIVQNNGFDLARWVNSVVREEWTVEVFDKALIREGASQERMVNMLQVALKCINPSPEARPSMNQVALMVNTIKEEEEERSIVFEP
ncbi:hypothetical protein HHK36_024902 [Tetracentron sinense]|uniref:Protein kinase domain-containing protein n=1 Tax=Tetracentron sinense TaxID=13715 RepID=A0A835D535_TETSI|nr:hypothetical protein HHK36_024902 [Tetracentron sinense]